MDRIGRLLAINEEMGIDLDLHFGYLKDYKKNDPQWFPFSHVKADGIGALLYVLHTMQRENAFNIPVLPNKYPTSFITKCKKLFDVVLQPVPSCKVKSKKIVDNQSNQNAFAWEIFTAEETQRIKDKVHNLNISLNAYLLYTLQKVLTDFYLFEDNLVAWRIPVNMRQEHNKTSISNLWSFVEIIFNLATSPQELQQLLKNHLVQKEYWGYFWLNNILGCLTPKTMLFFSNQMAKKGFSLTGVFSSLGDLSDPSQPPEEAFIAAPPVTPVVPIGGGTIIWANKLTLTLLLHASLVAEADIAKKILSAWRTALI